jgi:hypothetical protein
MHKHDQMLATLVLQYQQLAMMALGKLARPGEGMRRDLGEAAYCIDVLEAVQARTEGRLHEDITRLLATTLTDLRLNFVDESRKADGATAEPASTSDSGADA